MSTVYQYMRRCCYFWRRRRRYVTMFYIIAINQFLIIYCTRPEIHSVCFIIFQRKNHISFRCTSQLDTNPYGFPQTNIIRIECIRMANKYDTYFLVHIIFMQDINKELKYICDWETLLKSKW